MTMRDELVDYLLAALEPQEQADIEQQVRQVAELRQSLELLRSSFVPLEGDGPDDVEIPKDLAIRCCQRLHEIRLGQRPAT
jgi:hypothetical protein